MYDRAPKRMESGLESVRPILERAVHDGVTPGAQLAVVAPDGRLAELVVGTLDRRPRSSPVRPDTMYDLASLTKPVTALAWVCSGADLMRPLGDFLPIAQGAPAEAASLDELLSHRAGLLAWAPLYLSVPPDDRGHERGRAGVVRAALEAPVSADRSARYSDLGYILAGEALAAHTGLALSMAVQQLVLAPADLEGALTYRGVGAAWRDDPAVAPTECCPWRGLLRGEVHDDNAYTMGGVAGHAGIFGTAASLARLGKIVLDSLTGSSRVFPRDGVEFMLRPRPNGTQRLGWDGRSAVGSSAGSRAGPRTFGHLGFTGTSLWCDPDAGLVVALVTNRIHPSRENHGIRMLRPLVHDAVFEACKL